MMARTLRNEDTPFAREIWAAVDRAAEAAPEWMKEHVRRFIEEHNPFGLKGEKTLDWGQDPYRMPWPYPIPEVHIDG